MEKERKLTVTFYTTGRQKQALDEWSAEEYRSVSAVLRRILDQEIKRRQSRKNRNQ